MTTSKFLRPISVSIAITFFPNFESAMLKFAVMVVFPTPPLPDVQQLLHSFFPPKILMTIIFSIFSQE